MKFVILATTDFGICNANAIIDCGHDVCAIISMPKNSLPNNSADIKQYSIQKKIKYYEFADINASNAIEVLRRIEPDYIFSSWPKLISKEVLNLSRRFCIGTHPTSLPFNRGRHPLHWLIHLGISQTHLSFFKINEGVDAGNILLQFPINLNENDTINDANGKVNEAVYNGTKILCQKLVSNLMIEGEKQNHDLSNYWRMRTPHDVTVDLRMTAETIIKIVNSFTIPYPCANLIFKKYIIKVEAAKIINTAKSFLEIQRIEPGKVLSFDNNKITLKAGDKIIELSCIGPLPKEIIEADYIHPPSKYIMEYNIKI